MDITTLLTFGTTIVNLLLQVYKIEKAIQPELIATFEIWQTLVKSMLSGTEITEAQITALEAQIEILSAANAAKEQAIIKGEV